MIILNHYSNLQPLWKVDNYAKSKILPENYLEKFLEITLKINDLDALVEIFEKKYF